MRTSQYLLATLKEIPKNCELISHQLMLRAGLIRRISSGLYTWLPTGLRVLRKIENIIREEMNKIGAIEISMPIVQPAKLWKKSGRWKEYGLELLRFKNRKNQDYVLSPTHEEIITDLICKEITLHKQFPINIYQINVKYRDEARPCFGVVRSREFLMKDGYSFHSNEESLQNTYNNMYQTYNKIFNRIPINFHVVSADPGKIGGTLSHEFQAYTNFNVMNNIESIKYVDKNVHETKHNLKSVNIQLNNSRKIVNSDNKLSHISSTKDLINKFNLSMYSMTKTIVVHAKNTFSNLFDKKNISSKFFVGLVIRSDHKLSHQKIATIPEITIPISLVNLKDTYQITKSSLDISECINLSIPLIIDYNVITMIINFINKSDISSNYLFGDHWNHNVSLLGIADLYESNNSYSYSNIKKQPIQKKDYIEIGHIFQLGSKYSKIINHRIQKHHKKNNLIIKMGAYGIGITRIIGVVIEQNHDDNGIIWPESIAPFRLAIIPIKMYDSDHVKNFTEKIYNYLISNTNIDVLIDDRNERPGIMFADIDLIGIPHILIISEKNLKNEEIEYKYRKTGTIQKININILLNFLTKKFCS